VRKRGEGARQGTSMGLGWRQIVDLYRTGVYYRVKGVNPVDAMQGTMEDIRPPDGAGNGEVPSADGPDHRRSHHPEKLKADLIARLNRIEGQIRGIKGMIEKDTYCDHVLNQISAVQSALNGVGKLLLAGHMRSCVVERIREGDLDVVDELLTTVNKLLK